MKKIKKNIPLIIMFVIIFLTIDFFSSSDNFINGDYSYGNYYDINDYDEMLSIIGSKEQMDTYKDISSLIKGIVTASAKDNKIPKKYKNNIKSKKLFKKLNYNKYLDEIKLNNGDRIIGFINNDFYPPEGQAHPALIKNININDYKKSILLRLPVCKFKDVTTNKATVIVESDVRLTLNKKVRNDIKYEDKKEWLNQGDTIDITYYVPIIIDLVKQDNNWVIIDVKRRNIKDYIVLKEGLGFYNKLYYFSWYK